MAPGVLNPILELIASAEEPAMLEICVNSVSAPVFRCCINATMPPLAANLPKSCDELYESGEDRDGVFRIDPDGNGPVEPVLVKCEMSDSDGAITYVDHNFVNGTYVRQADKKDTTYSVVYR